MDNEEPREGVVVKAPSKKLVLAVEVEDSGKLSRIEEMAQEIEKLRKRLNELEGPTGKQGRNLGKVVGTKVTSSVSGVENQDTFLKNAKGDISGVIILRLSKTYEERGNLKKAREKLAGSR